MELDDNEFTMHYKVESICIKYDGILKSFYILVCRLKDNPKMVKHRGVAFRPIGVGNPIMHHVHQQHMMHEHPPLMLHYHDPKINTVWTTTSGSKGHSTVHLVDMSRFCGRCRSELGRIMNRGAVCRVCKVRVCKSCREYGKSGDKSIGGSNGCSTDWTCTFCYRNG